MSKVGKEEVNIIEVGPRDGLQNESKILSIEDKIEFICRLADAGLTSIEATSFVRADKIPQMGDASALYTSLLKRTEVKNCRLPCLIPNLKGFENALAVGVKEIALFSSTSELFNKKNINASIEESFDRFVPVAKKALDSDLKIRGYISTAFGCPYEGETSLDTLQHCIERFIELGVDEISIGDTIGVASPSQVRKTLTSIKKNFDLKLFAMHFHDTRSLALANCTVSLEEGIRSFDSSAGGLGGCPYADGASGNIDTEGLLFLIEKMNYKTSVSLSKVANASAFILAKLKKVSLSKVHHLVLNGAL